MNKISFALLILLANKIQRLLSLFYFFFGVNIPLSQGIKSDNVRINLGPFVELLNYEQVKASNGHI